MKELATEENALLLALKILKMSKILKISIVLIFLIFFVIFLFPLFVSAEKGETVEITPPIRKEIAEAPPPVVIGKVVEWIMGVIGALAVLMIVYGGLQYIFSGGDERQVRQAKGILLWSIVGLLISVFAYVIVWAILKVAGGE